ncbi:hypothetical protein J0A71_11g24470 [Encephalitozoon cuniculi]|nr:hypothetical protein J0A71_01g00080 [Encephalitozoon cuniculi]UYI26433.1 hypothetical protein J0A71_01g02530 [Encephalitozoon cuniculi]UYI26448.1 hypothetical protein J0A71_02g02730 [Encephalitozoon cuniculi]UYI26658.1 hypothetical protein J0A71_02g04890 [Encephalitozoon cuniculi]UYI26675.1 hypothetical protein J0A71_03g05100 [Encephalitozoon cuniculi]
MQGVAWGLLEKLAGLDRLRIGWSALAWQSRGVGWARPSIGDVQGLLPSTRMLKRGYSHVFNRASRQALGDVCSADYEQQWQSYRRSLLCSHGVE